MVPMEQYSDMKPFSPSAERNQAPIAKRLGQFYGQVKSVLEIASGTGQHACYFSNAFPHLTWQPSELPDKLAGIQQWVEAEGASNCASPIILDVTDPSTWPRTEYDAAFSANTAHIMTWMQVIQMFQGISQSLRPGGIFTLYGPFNYNHEYTSTSNAEFDQFLKQRDQMSGIRDSEAVQALAADCGFTPLNDYAMPANNRLLVWRK